MAYIGTSPSNGVRRKHTYTATAGQTSFSGNDDNGISLVYVDTEYLDVYQNGVKLVAVSDYASTTGTSVVLTQGASVSDIIEIIVFDIFSVADTVSAKDGGNFGGDISSGGLPVKVAGKESMWIPALAMNPTVTNGCASHATVETTSGRPDMIVLDFDKDSDEFAQFAVAFPKSWNEGTITYQVFWTPSNTNTGNCLFNLYGVAVGDGDTIDVAFGTEQTVTDAGIGTVEDQQVSAESSAVTIAGSPAVDQQTYFQIFRDANAGGDTYTGVARLLGIKIFFTTDAANDA